jgi:hypothetical protein
VRLGPWLCLLVIGCGAEALDTPIDAGDPVDAEVIEPGSPWLELGGGFPKFAPLVEGQTVELVRGPQSLGRYYGYHIWFSVRASGFDPVGVAVKFVGTTSTATVVDTAFTFNLVPYEGGHEASGFRGLISDCCITKGQVIDVVLTLVDRSGRVGVDRRRVHAEGDCRVPRAPSLACQD